MRKVLVYSPDPLDGLSFFRQWGPLSLMHDQVQCVNFPNRTEEITHWTWYLNYDIVMMNRPHKMADVAFMNEAKKWGLKIWLDYDDDLLSIPEDNPVYETFANDGARTAIQQAFEMADVITTPGPILFRELSQKYPGKVVQLPNAMDDRLLRYRKEFQASKKVAWRGSQSHLIDLMVFAEAIAAPLRTRPGWQCLFSGINPVPVGARLGPKSGVEMLFAKPRNLIDFVRNYTNFNPAFHIVPLVKNRFNEIKSSLSWLDGTLAGAVTLMPDNEAWAECPGFKYKFGDPSDFQTQFNKMLGYPEANLKMMVKGSWELIQEKFLLSKLNKIRKEIIEGL